VLDCPISLLLVFRTRLHCVGGNVFVIASCFYVKNFVCCRFISARCQLMRLVEYVITIIGKVLRKIEELNER